LHAHRGIDTRIEVAASEHVQRNLSFLYLLAGVFDRSRRQVGQKLPERFGALQGVAVENAVNFLAL
jgi:hypothetical protein